LKLGHYRLVRQCHYEMRFDVEWTHL